MTVILDQTLENIEVKVFMDLKPTILHRQLVYDDQISRPMTNLLATFTYVCMFDVQA